MFIDDPDAALFRNKMKKKASNMMSPAISIPSQIQTPSSTYQKGFVKTEFAIKQECNFSPEPLLKFEGLSQMALPSGIGSQESSVKLKPVSELQKTTDISKTNSICLI